MKKHDPQRLELSARDVVARANYREIKEGRGTPHRGVWLDISKRSKAYILEKLPNIHEQFIRHNKIDISKEKMEVAPTAHYSMGGIMVDHLSGKTSVSRLYSIGEVTAGVHGANRLGGNSLAEVLVFGRLTGKAIAQTIHEVPWLPLEEHQVKTQEAILQSHCCEEGEDPNIVKENLQRMMWEHVGVIRREEEMIEGLNQLKAFSQIKLKTGMSKVMNQKLMSALDIRNMLPTCEMIFLSALYRKESRGAHFRSDFPSIDPQWKKNIICTATQNGFQLTTRAVGDVPTKILSYLNNPEIGFDHERHMLE